jgi:hypothetical protein
MDGPAFGARAAGPSGRPPLSPGLTRRRPTLRPGDLGVRLASPSARRPTLSTLGMLPAAFACGSATHTSSDRNPDEVGTSEGRAKRAPKEVVVAAESPCHSAAGPRAPSGPSRFAAPRATAAIRAAGKRGGGERGSLCAALALVAALAALALGWVLGSGGLRGASERVSRRGGASPEGGRGQRRLDGAASAAAPPREEVVALQERAGAAAAEAREAMARWRETL